MAVEISEGLLFDLLAKRRAGKFTADDLLWTAANAGIVSGLRTGKLRVVSLDGAEVFNFSVQVISEWDKLLAACNQEWHDGDFTEARFPLEPVVVDEAEWEVREHFFHDDATYEEKLRRLKEMAEQGEIRLCGTRRGMEDTVLHPDIQLNHPRVVPISAQNSRGIFCLHVFGGGDWGSGKKERRIYVNGVSHSCHRRYGWLVLRLKKRT